MALEVGSQIAHYHVTTLIGEGGMGQVYRARDTKLDRDVALKVLPPAFTNDPDRLARFEREAKVLASLSHPNIGGIHGLEESEGTKALVLEYIEGPTLADRIAQGPIPVDEALPIAKQIAEALEAAHESGIIHRDLKPTNIKLRPDGTVKVLDFGLAKALDTAPEGDPNQSPTLTAAATQMGVIMGTAAYMSPEQARGKPVDRRADIWAFGAVVYEMLSGTQPFPGEDVSQTLARVVDRDPDWTVLPRSLPVAFATYLRRCLAKEPRERIRDIGDVRLAIEGAFDSATRQLADVSRRRTWPGSLVGGLALLLTMVAGALGWGWMTAGHAPTPTVSRFSFYVPEGELLRGFALSPDGSTLVYSAGYLGEERLFLRPRDQLRVRSLAGTDGAVFPFFSPDGAWVGFFDGTALKKVALAGGTPVTLCSACSAGGSRGATWGPNGAIVFASNDAAGLMQIADVGGQPRALTIPEEGVAHGWPRFTADGTHVVYTRMSSFDLRTHQLVVLSVETQAEKVVVQGTDGTVTRSGYLVFGREGALWAVPFDGDPPGILGEPAPIVEGVQVDPNGRAQYAAAEDGTLAYQSEGDRGGESDLLWVDRETGTETPVAAPTRRYDSVRFSPDGSRLAVSIRDQGLWVWDFARETLTRVTFGGEDTSPVWTPDGQRLIFGRRSGVFWRAADGSGVEEQLADLGGGSAFPNFVVPNGNTIVAAVMTADADIVSVRPDHDPTTEDLVATEFNEAFSGLSPSGQWLAYSSNASGQQEVYVRPFPNVSAAQFQVSTRGGWRPVWTRDGDELFYENGGRVFVVPVQTEPTFSWGTAEVVLDGYNLVSSRSAGRLFDVHPSGERFMVTTPSGGEDSRPELVFVLNWQEELKRLLP